ncbi:MAG: tetratricopeptide repeat protein [Candidatus Kariarchaeaceae archaeon]
MTVKFHEELEKAELLFKKGIYEKALEITKILPTHTLGDLEKQLECLFLEGKIYVKVRKFDEAQSLFEEISKTAIENKFHILSAEILVQKSEILWRSSKYDESLQIIEETEELLAREEIKHNMSLEKKIHGIRSSLLNHKAVIFWYLGELDQALEYGKHSLRIREELFDKYGMATVFNSLGLIYTSKGNLDQAIKNHKESLLISEELGNTKLISTVLSNLGIVCQMKGEVDQALEYHQWSLPLKEEIGDDYGIALSFINIGVNFRMKGDLNKALFYYQRSKRILTDLENKNGIALALNNIGDVYQLKGELKLALDCYQQSLAIYEKLGMKQEIAMSLLNIGEIYSNQGNPEWAKRSYQQSLRIYKEVQNEPSICTVLYLLVLLFVQINEISTAHEYLQELQKISNRLNNSIVNHRYKIAYALTLKMSKRARDKVKSVEILEKLVAEEIIDHSLHMTAMIHLCDLLLYELKITGEEELLETINNLSNRLIDIAKEQSSYSLLVESYVIKSKIKLLELDIINAQELMDQALLIAEERDLRSLAIKVYSDKTLLEAQIDQWQYLVKHKAPLNERIEISRLEDIITRVTNNQIILTEEEIDRYSERSKQLTQPWDKAKKLKYKLEYLDLLKGSSITEKSKFRVGIAQIGLSKSGDILNENYEEKSSGLFQLRKDKVEDIRYKVKEMIEIGNSENVNVLLFPELTIDFNYDQLLQDIISLSKVHNMYVVPGSYHDHEKKENICLIIGPDGVLWEQRKHIPATIHFGGKKFTEGIKVDSLPPKSIICNTEFGRIVVSICRDFLDMDLRVEFKNFEPPVDLILNPAFTPVTADFKAAHFDARRSIFAYCFFANIAEFGGSFIYTPEKERVERIILAKEEGLIYKDVDLFGLRSERKKWEIEQEKQIRFIQSTR